MYSEELEWGALMPEEDEQDCALKSFLPPLLSGLTQTLDPAMLTSIGIVVWVAGSRFYQWSSGGGERSFEC
jgi:hypothetical protein